MQILVFCSFFPSPWIIVRWAKVNYDKLLTFTFLSKQSQPELEVAHGRQK